MRVRTVGTAFSIWQSKCESAFSDIISADHSAIKDTTLKLEHLRATNETMRLKIERLQNKLTSMEGKETEFEQTSQLAIERV